MPYDPYPMLSQIMKVRTSAEMIGVDLENPQVWTRPAVTDYQFLSVHWGGGANPAGWPIEEPALTFAQKVAVQIGRVGRVLRSWLAYHKSKGMSTIAYSTWVDSLFGRLGKLRGHRYNGGQWHRINTITHALVLVMGFGQKASRLAWRTVGLVWFCSGGPRVVGHRFFNDWPETEGPTACPGDENSAIIERRGYIDALGVLARGSRGKVVRAATLKLARLRYLDRMRSRYTSEVAEAVRTFQLVHHLPMDGKIGPATWMALAGEESW